MQARHRSPREGFRFSRWNGKCKPNPSSYRNSHRNGFRRDHSKPRSPRDPLRKADILREAGRLAAEYFVSKGLLSPSSLPEKCPRDEYKESKRKDREPSNSEDHRALAFPPGRKASPEAGRGRREYSNDRSRVDSRYHSNGGRRNEHSGGGRGSDWDRGNGSNGRRTERTRRLRSSVVREDDSGGSRRNRRRGLDEAESSASRAADERYSISEVTGESVSEENSELADDTGSKGIFRRTRRKDRPPEVNVDLCKVGDDRRVLKSEVGGKSKSNVDHEDQQQVPKKPHSSQASRSPKLDQCRTTGAKNRSSASIKKVSKVIMEEDIVGGSSNSSVANPISSSKGLAHRVSSILCVQDMGDYVFPQNNSSQSAPGFAKPMADARDEAGFAQNVDKREGMKRKRGLSPSRVHQQNEFSGLHDPRTKQSSLCTEKLSSDEELVEAVDHTASIPKVEAKFDINHKEDQQLPRTSFKFFDLNVTEAPEIVEIPDDPVLDHPHTSAPSAETGKEQSVDFGFSTSNCTKGNDSHSQFSGNAKVIPVINLDDDSPAEVDISKSFKSKSEAIYSGLNNFLSHKEHPEPPGVHDGYPAAASEFLGTSIPDYPSAQANFGNLQTGMSLHDAQGVSCVDDTIYASLEEFPIGYMGVWDP